ncbi:hypothetical protein AB1N83_007652 [Pleurotus pulmonarius]
MDITRAGSPHASLNLALCPQPLASGHPGKFLHYRCHLVSRQSPPWSAPPCESSNTPPLQGSRRDSENTKTNVVAHQYLDGYTRTRPPAQSTVGSNSCRRPLHGPHSPIFCLSQLGNSLGLGYGWGIPQTLVPGP